MICLPEKSGYWNSSQPAVRARLRIQHVLRWLGHEMTVTCSSAQDSYPVENVLNGGENFWYSKYDPVEGQHYLQITFTNPEDIDGFIYRARPKESEAGKGNMGVLYKYRLELIR